MTLEESLATIREASSKRLSPENQAIMHRANEDLRTSGILAKMIKVGHPLPAFSLQNAYGREVSSSDLLARGPLVLTVFRGSW
jgi:hypothetical protein